MDPNKKNRKRKLIPKTDLDPGSKKRKVDPVQAKQYRMDKQAENKVIRFEAAKQREKGREQKAEERLQQREMKAREEFERFELDVSGGFTRQQPCDYQARTTAQTRFEFWKNWCKWNAWWAKIVDTVRKKMDSTTQQQLDAAREDMKAAKKVVSQWKRKSKDTSKGSVSPVPVTSTLKLPVRKVKCRDDKLLYTHRVRTLSMVVEDLKVPDLLLEVPTSHYVRKIPLDPTTDQKRLLWRFISAYRRTYNTR